MLIELSFREATDEDFTVCAEIISTSEAWTDFGINFDRAVELLKTMDDKIYIAENGDNPVGFITLKINGMGNFGAYIRMIAVKKEFRNTGIGKKLIEFVEALAFEHNRNIFLICASTNLSAIDFYKRIGFEEIGLLKDLIVKGHDEILFRKRLL